MLWCGTVEYSMMGYYVTQRAVTMAEDSREGSVLVKVARNVVRGRRTRWCLSPCICIRWTGEVLSLLILGKSQTTGENRNATN